MSLAQRVREQRYAKGWGPDELASRADISRTALYQIESGKTELPRASTLRRIALALEVPMDALLDHEALSVFATSVYPETETPTPTRVPRATAALPAEVAVLKPEAAPARGRRTAVNARQRELERMFQELLESPLGEGVARIVEESHRLMQSRSN